MFMSGSPMDFRTTNALWCSVLAESLARLGLATAVISPGSRSTPLTMALVRHGGIEVIPVLDERSAAFFALGLAKRTRRPVVLVCTSGTAGANYFPAIIEAFEGGVPLIVITADRPAELRACASGQTIDQQKLFGGYVKWQHELSVPEPHLERLRYLRQMLVQAWDQASAPLPGPVHLNAPFRDPLAPVADGSTASLAASWDPSFFDALTPPAVSRTQVTYWQRANTARGLIVAGPASPEDPADYVRAVEKLSRDSGWPVLADIQSPLRTHRSEGFGVIGAYDAILRDERWARELMPRQILCLGGWPTSKVLRSWIERSQAETLLVANTLANRDALHGRTRQIVASVESLVVQGAPLGDGSYRAAWDEAERLTRARLDAALAGDSLGVFEGQASWWLARTLPAGTPVFVASSMPVRDVEYFWPAHGGRQRLYFSRGANGIDGTLSTALGIAHGGPPAVLLTGDLALLHDTNGFLSVPRLRGSLTIVMINNAGGGIFEHLPVAQFDPPFEQYFATPQKVDFARLAAAYEVDHLLVRDWAQFESLTRELPASGVRLLEIRTDRKKDAATRRRLLQG